MTSPRLRLPIPIYAGFVGLAIFKLFLITGQVRYAIGRAAHDDALFVRLASHLANGEWLGPYDSFTLIKGVGYPLWIAVNSFLPMPLYVADHLLYAAACLFFALAIRPVSSGTVALVVFCVLLFNPFTTGVASLRFVRDSLYTSQTLLFLAFTLGLLVRARAGSGWLEAWAVASGLALGFLWITREEGIWIVPAGAVAYLILGSRLSLSLIGWRRQIVVMALPLVLWGACLLAVSIQNYRYYGLFTTNEVKREEFVAAYGTITRVKHAKWRRYVPVPRETMSRLFEVSPTFQRLQPLLEGERGRMWSRNGRSSLKLGPDYAEEIPGGWFMWAFRDAAQRSGHYGSSQTAMQFYRNVAAEVETAIQDGTLPAESSRGSLAPPWRGEYVAPLVRSVVRGIHLLVTFADYSPEGPASTPPLELMRHMSGDRLSREDQSSGQILADGNKLEILSDVAAIYRIVMPLGSALSVIVYLSMLIVPRLRRRGAFLAFNAVLLSAIFTRLILLAFIDVSSFRAIDEVYLLPLYPLLLAFCALVTSDAVAGHSST